MEILIWAVAINWGIPLLGYSLYALVTWLIMRDYVYEGFKFPAIHLRLTEPEDKKGKLEPWHVKLWGEWAGHGGLLWIFYRDRPSSVDDAWVLRTKIHELRHSLQGLTLGLLMLLFYIGHSLYIYFFQEEKHPYYDNWFERDARKAAGQLVDVPREKWGNGPNDRWSWW
jgi:hypothetical protein